ncbi:MAG: hypothetical protein NVS3B20_05230 [Polyangiales bacterium]
MSSHPHFDDKGLRWHTKLEDALAEAKKDGKHVLIEYGRETCGNCRSLVTAVMPSAHVRPEIEAHFVLLAADCDNPEPGVRTIGAHHMAQARSLPFVMFLNSEGQFVYGTQGARDAHTVLHDLLHGREHHAPH